MRDTCASAEKVADAASQARSVAVDCVRKAVKQLAEKLIDSVNKNNTDEDLAIMTQTDLWFRVLRELGQLEPLDEVYRNVRSNRVYRMRKYVEIVLSCL